MYQFTYLSISCVRQFAQMYQYYTTAYQLCQLIYQDVPVYIPVHQLCQLACQNVPVLHKFLLVVSANLSRCTSFTYLSTSGVSQFTQMYQFYIPVHQWCQLVYQVYQFYRLVHKLYQLAYQDVQNVPAFHTCPPVVSASLPRCTRFTYLSTCCVSQFTKMYHFTYLSTSSVSQFTKMYQFYIPVHQQCQLVYQDVSVLHTCSPVVSASLPRCTSFTYLSTCCVSQFTKMYQFYIPVLQQCQLVYQDVSVLHTCPPVVSASLPRCASLQSVPVKLITDIVTLKNKFHGLLVHFDIGKE